MWSPFNGCVIETCTISGGVVRCPQAAYGHECVVWSAAWLDIMALVTVMAWQAVGRLAQCTCCCGSLWSNQQYNDQAIMTLSNTVALLLVSF